jgi:type II secretory pathway pseudopilin PulG
MIRPPAARGFTILEALIAMVVLTIGSIGMMSLLSTGQRINNDARQMTRAVAVGQDLLGQIALWQYTDARLASGATAGADITDEALAFQRQDSPTYDHSDTELISPPATGANFNGIPTAGLDGLYQRYWNVSYVDDSNANGVWDGVRIAVIVRWRQSGGWRRVVLTGFKPNSVE